MRTTITRLTVALALLLAGAAFAGGDHKCGKNAQDCLESLATRLQAKGWVGIETDKNEDGFYRVSRVIEGSPAEAAGFRKGDVLLGLGGISFASENKEALMKAKKNLAPGKEVEYTVKRTGTKRQIAVKLAKVPDILIAQWIGEHMLDQHAHVQVAAK